MFEISGKPCDALSLFLVDGGFVENDFQRLRCMKAKFVVQIHVRWRNKAAPYRNRKYLRILPKSHPNKKDHLPKHHVSGGGASCSLFFFGGSLPKRFF